MSTSAATTFTLFPKLAPELRIKIWQYACEPRTVSVRYIPSLDRCLSPPNRQPYCKHAMSPQGEALRMFSLSFGTRSSPPRIYFNPYRDTLYLPRHRQMGYDETLRDFGTLVVDGMLDEVRLIAVDHVDVEIKRPWESYNKASLIRGFPHLHVVDVVLCAKNTGTEDWGREVQFVEPREDIEEILRIWAGFRAELLVMQERDLEEICKMIGRDYVKFSLPTVRIKTKMLKIWEDGDDA